MHALRLPGSPDTATLSAAYMKPSFPDHGSLNLASYPAAWYACLNTLAALSFVDVHKIPISKSLNSPFVYSRVKECIDKSNSGLVVFAALPKPYR